MFWFQQRGFRWALDTKQLLGQSLIFFLLLNRYTFLQTNVKNDKTEIEIIQLQFKKQDLIT